MSRIENQHDEMVDVYDNDAEASGWFGPEVAFGLAYSSIQPGQSILDIGIGTGLGSVLFQKAGLKVYGMDISEKMLDVCRSKGFTDLRLHDLSNSPYPYDSESVDHAVCTGVLNFFSDLSPVFQETARIIRKEGLFAFVVGDRVESEAHEIRIGSEHTKSKNFVMMYRHSPKQVDTWLDRYGFELLRSLAFIVFMDRERTLSMKVKAYLARKVTGSNQAFEAKPTA